MKRIAIIALIFAQIGFFTVCPSLVHAAMRNDAMMEQGMHISMAAEHASIQPALMECCRETNAHIEQVSQPISPITGSAIMIAEETRSILTADIFTQDNHPTFFCATSPPFHERQLGKRE